MAPMPGLMLSPVTLSAGTLVEMVALGEVTAGLTAVGTAAAAVAFVVAVVAFTFFVVGCVEALLPATVVEGVVVNSATVKTKQNIWQLYIQ